MTKRAISMRLAGIVGLLLTGGAVSFADLNTGLIAHYPFDGDANDASGNGNNGIVSGAVLTSDRQNRAGSAYHFAASDYINVPFASSLNPTNAFTLTAWIKADDWNGNRRILQKGHDGSASEFQYLLYGSGESGTNSLIFGIGNPTFSTLRVVWQVVNEWHHVTAVYDGSAVILYVDGNPVGSQPASGTIRQSSAPVYIGNKPAPNTRDAFHGSIDDARIYNRALSPAEVQQLHLLGRQLSSVIVTGPTIASAGIATPYTCTAHFSDGSTGDFSTLATWSTVGSVPPGTQFSRNSLIGGSAVTGDYPITIKATYSSGGETRTATNGVTIRPQFTTWFGASWEYLCDTRSWRMTADAFAMNYSGSPPSYTWDFTDIVGSATAAGQHVTRSLTSAGRALVRLVATNSEGEMAISSKYVALDLPPPEYCSGTSYPATREAIDVLPGGQFNSSGASYAGDSLRADVGLVVIIHGMCQNALVDWPAQLAQAVEARLGVSATGPNVCLYDWEDMADPSLFFEGTSRCDNWFEAVENALMVRPGALAHGRILADWIKSEIAAGRVNPNKPIHLIGHSAGGFVAGECALTLKQLGILNTYVTMLDTPEPLRRHFTQYPNPGKVERYITSVLGMISLEVDGLGCNPELLPVYALFLNVWGVLYQAAKTAISCEWQVDPGPYYHKSEISGLAYTAEYGISNAHHAAHEWYRESILDSGVEDGFWYSPWVGHSFPTGGGGGAVPPGAKGNDQGSKSLTDEPITNFQAFGYVTPANEVYTIQDAGNGGIYKLMTMPIGAKTLRFRYRFPTAGDGDFFSVHWGTNAPLFIGNDLSICRTNSLEAEVSVAEFAGQTNNLVFKLVSRGATNAVLVLDQITMTISDDADGDGLLNAVEGVLETNPLKYDTDGDGLSDGIEVALKTNPLLTDTDGDGISDGEEVAGGTDPKSAASVFKIMDVKRNPDGSVVLQWASGTNKLYRVNRSLEPSRGSYTTLTNAMPGTPPVNSFTDTTATNARAFYWIEVQ